MYVTIDVFSTYVCFYIFNNKNVLICFFKEMSLVLFLHINLIMNPFRLANSTSPQF